MIEAIITDFDGTLVDTFEANFRAYEKAFALNGHVLSKERYKACFGARFDDFMKQAGIRDDQAKASIRQMKAAVYPEFFDRMAVNEPLMRMMRKCRESGYKTAIASTARRENLCNVLNHFGIHDIFDLILTGSDVTHAKPHPEIYTEAMRRLGVAPAATLIFEDSPVGIEAAAASGANYMRITELFFQ